MRIVAGLGNPGARYAANRHNIGFMAADAVADRAGLSGWSKKFKAEIAEGDIGGEKILLMKPQTFMNLSGEAVGEAMRFFKLQPSDVTVIYDELDLAPGKARIKTGGGHGGHNGIKSLDAHLGKDYKRLRLGIGHPGGKELVHNHVLGDFAKADREWLDPLLEAIGENIGLLVTDEDSSFLNKLALAVGGRANDDTPSPKSEKARKGTSHIRQANRNTAAKVPEKGPMADMLKKLFGGKE